MRPYLAMLLLAAILPLSVAGRRGLSATAPRDGVAWLAQRPAGARAADTGAARGVREGEDAAVSVELFIMSQCPDANFCEHALAPVVAQLRSIVQVTTRYIQHFDDGGAVVCKHGEGECRGNLLQLCTQAHVPPEHNFDWFYRSLLCGWDSGLPANDTSRLDSCLSQVGVDDGLKGSIQGCYDGSEGSDLMQANTQLIEARGIPNSCTVVVDGTPRCVRDGGEWRDCPGGSEPADFVQTLCDAYKTKTGTAAFECPPAPSAA